MLIRILVTILFVLFSAGVGSAKVYLDINQARSLFPIAIVDFKNLDGQADMYGVSRSMARTISQDLDATGLFQVLDPESFLEDPKTAGINEGEINFQNWTAIGAQGLVKGGFSRNGNQITIEARLFDAQSGRYLVGRRYIGTDQTVRRIAHKFANLIYSTLTGEEGVFETKIAYVSEDKGQKEIYLMDFDGFDPKRFSYHGSIALSPRWSPDGTRISFTSYKRDNPDLYVKTIASRDELLLSHFPGLNITAAWAPNGQEIALTLSKDGNPEIYLMGAQGGFLRRLTNYWGIDVSPTWSPDGKRIAFVSDRSGTPQIYIMDREGKNLQRLTFQGNYNSEPDWSPRGDKIVYSSQRGGFQVCVINVDGSGDMQLTQEGRNEYPKWAPNGLQIVFSSTRAGGKQIFTMRANGTQVRQITKGGYNYNPSWSPLIH